MFNPIAFTVPLAMIGTNEILIIAGVAVLMFGGSKLPELMRGMGQGIREFKSAANEAATVNEASLPTSADGKAAQQPV